MIDSLQKVHDTLYIKTIEQYELIDRVNSFYNSAWEKLILFGSIAIAIIGIAFPVILELLKKRQYRIDKQDLIKNLKEDLDNTIDILSKETEKNINTKLSKVDNQLKLIEQKSKAGIYFMQGRLSIDSGNRFQALPNFLTSLKSSMLCNDVANIISALQIIRVECLPFLSLEALDILKGTYNMDIDSFLSEITSFDKTGVFSFEISQIKIILKKMPKTQQELKELLETMQKDKSSQKSSEHKD